MNSKKLIRLISLFIVIFLFVFVGTTVLKYKNSLEANNELLVQLLFFTSFIEIGTYYLAGEYKSKLNLNSIIFPILRLVISTLFYNDVYSLESFCLIWGIFECIRSLVNIPKNIYIVYRHKEYLRIAEIVISIVEFIFGLLLAIGTLEHLRSHLFVFGLTLFATALIFVIDFILSAIENKQRH